MMVDESESGEQRFDEHSVAGERLSSNSFGRTQQHTT